MEGKLLNRDKGRNDKKRISNKVNGDDKSQVVTNLGNWMISKIECNRISKQLNNKKHIT